MKQAKDMNRDDDIHSGGRRGGDRHSSLDSNTLPFEFVLFSFFLYNCVAVGSRRPGQCDLLADHCTIAILACVLSSEIHCRTGGDIGDGRSGRCMKRI